MNTGYRTPDEVRTQLARLTGQTVDESVTVFPPFYSEFGRNLTLGKDIFINMGCRFQDTGGITIGDGTLIGHGSFVAAYATTPTSYRERFTSSDSHSA